MNFRGPRFKQGAPMLGLALALAGAAGCENDVNYGYFSVKVTLADTMPEEVLARISSCGANVEGDDLDFAPLDCRLGQVNSRDIGTFEWSTSSTGTVRFRITVKDITGKDLALGVSGDQRIVPGGTVPVTVEATPTEEALKPRM